MTTDNEILNAYNETGSKAGAAKLLGMPRSTFQGRFKKITEGSDFLENASETLGFPTEAVSEYWVKSGTGSFRVKMDEKKEFDKLEAYKDAFKSLNGISPIPIIKEETNDTLLTVYPIADLHLGMLAWGDETGDDYDMKIAEDLVLDSMGQLIAQSKPSKTALIANIGDFLHVNDSKNMTPASGNILDMDTRYYKLIYTAVRVFVKLVDIALSKHDHVIIRNVQGNHDKDSIVALNVALSLFYSNNPRVTVIDSPKQFWYYLFGNTLIGLYHGHTCKPEVAAMNMACDSPVEWGKSKYRWMLHGHFHHQKVKEVGNVLVEGFGTLAAKDAYAAEHGYTSSRYLSAITIHETRGEIGRHRVNV